MPTTTTSISIELELLLSGTYIPYTPATPPSYASGGDPPCGDVVEDADITDIVAEVTTATAGGQRIVTRSSLLTGVNLKSPDVQALLGNLFNAFDSDIWYALRQEALSHEP